jgi:hypothetical protein
MDKPSTVMTRESCRLYCVFQSRCNMQDAGTPFNIHRAINIITASGGGYTIIGIQLMLTLPELLLMMDFANRFVGIESSTLTPVSLFKGITSTNFIFNLKCYNIRIRIFTGISVLTGSVNVELQLETLLVRALGIMLFRFHQRYLWD